MNTETNSKKLNTKRQDFNGYDPVKIMNKKWLLNDVAIKYRYDLMYINDYYNEGKLKFKDNNTFNNIRGLLDKDINDFRHKIKNDDLKTLIYRNEIIRNNMINSGIFEVIENMDHTSLLKMKNIYSNRTKGTISSNNDKISKLNSLNLRFHPYYKNFKLEERKNLMIKNKQLYGYSPVVKKNTEQENLNNHYINETKSIHNLDLSRNTQLESNKKKLEKKRKIEKYGKLPKIKRKSIILTSTNDEEDVLNISKGYNDAYIKLISNTEESQPINLPQISINKEFSNISLHSKGIELLKNSLFSKEELNDNLKSKQLKKSFDNSVSNPVKIKNLSKNKVSLSNLITSETDNNHDTTDMDYEPVIAINEGYVLTPKRKRKERKKSILTLEVFPKITEQDNIYTIDETGSNLPINNNDTRISKTKRITFDELNSRRNKKIIKLQQTQLSEISDKIADTYSVLNREIDRVNYKNEEDDLYFKNIVIKESQESVKENLKKYFKRYGTFND